ncbi:MAG: hypothetical protein WCS57_01340 [Bacillota bacterium]|nr:hypothetical protein [Bacillota bacterium]
MGNRYSPRFSGGSSVLAVLLMLLLITLGAVALVSSNNNFKMLAKGADWVKDYYVLEADGERLIQMVSGCLQEASFYPLTYDLPEDIWARAFRDSLESRLGKYLEAADSRTPYDNVIDKVSIETVDPTKLLVTVNICQDSGSTDRYLLIQMEVEGLRIYGSNDGKIRILKWKQYQEPFEYEAELDLWE